jgi:hypothetical protein
LVFAGVDVEGHGAGPGPRRIEELGQQDVIGTVTSLFGDRGFETGKGRLAGKVGTGEGSAATSQLEGRIIPEGFGVVGVFVAGGNLVDALADEVEEGVLNAVLSPGVVAAVGDGLGEPKGAVEVSQEEEAAVGGEGAAGEIDMDGFARQQRKVEHRLRIRHRRMFPFCAFR